MVLMLMPVDGMDSSVYGSNMFSYEFNTCSWKHVANVFDDYKLTCLNVTAVSLVA
jgi:hypothetical protein